MFLSRFTQNKYIIRDCDPCLEAFGQGKLGFKNFKILNKCHSDLECDVQEAFLIKKYKPKMNNQLFEEGACVTLKLFT